MRPRRTSAASCASADCVEGRISQISHQWSHTHACDRGLCESTIGVIWVGNLADERCDNIIYYLCTMGNNLAQEVALALSARRLQYIEVSKMCDHF